MTEAGRGDPLRTRDWGRVLIGVAGWPFILSDIGRRDSLPLDGGLEKPSNVPSPSKVSCRGLTGGKGNALTVIGIIVEKKSLSDVAPERGLVDLQG